MTESRAGTGGLTVFADSSTADVATIHNHGATYNKGGGGATHFLNNSTARTATITNHADATFLYSSMSGQHRLLRFVERRHRDDRKRKRSQYIQRPGPDPIPQQLQRRRRRQSTIEETQRLAVAPAASPSSTTRPQLQMPRSISMRATTSRDARTSIISPPPRTPHITIINTNPPGGSSNGGGGNLIFHDDSTADHAQITLKAQACCNGVQFKDHATAANATIVQEDGSGRITFTENATAGNASFSVGQDNEITFFNQSTAANAIIAMANRARLQFTTRRFGRPVAN